ncbi:DUF4276 family protein [uncultured Bacteroides sp.]|uniref:DUF4276 family protein n=1 Tax=uncultured Bacteroides sp. TaxID=162156 RepID=UPI002612EBBD|nr:DUF4276 family protein [uncultured Bacteroides sp.]
MKRLYIIVEGQTEQDFVKNLIAPYLQDFGIYNVTPILIRTSRSGRGGMVNYQHLQNTIKMLLSSLQTDFVVTTFIDFFRLPNNMPQYTESMKISDKQQQIQALEVAIDKAINDNRFFSYIQLHEFEALLFSSNKGFEYYFPDELAKETASIISSYDNPEDINTSPEGAPSKRLLAIKPDYNKVLEGNLIALEIGIKSILEKCPGFAEWINRIVERCKE